MGGCSCGGQVSGVGTGRLGGGGGPVMARYGGGGGGDGAEGL